jgi:uncharacterized repeat protein (TIGR02543 family)
VTYLANSASSGTVPTDATAYTQNQSATAANNSGTLARTDYTFGGWNTAADGSGTSYVPGSASIAMHGGNVTLYAKWTATVTYLANNATSGTVPIDNTDYTQNQSATAANNTGSLAQTGYTFSGWNTAADGSGTTYAAGSGNIPMAGGNVTLYAKWTVITNYTLTYTAGANGSITGTSPQTVASGGNGTAVSADPDIGYHFVDWSDSSTSNPRQDLAVSGNITVTANFAINTIAYNTWASTYAGGGLPDGDSNNDGVSNGVAFFMNATGIATNPALNATTRTVTWTNGGIIPSSEYGTQFVVQTSDDLAAWTDASSSDSHLTNTSGSVSYTFTGTAPHFVRLKVTPNPD